MKMNNATLCRLGAISAIAGGALRIFAAFVPYREASPLLETLYAAVDMLLLFGLMAVYVAHADRLGGTGLAGFVLSAFGLASIVGPDAMMLGVDFYQAGALLLLLGLGVLSVALFRARRMRASAALWAGSGVLVIAGALVAQPGFVMVSGILFGFGFVLAGADMLSEPVLAC